MTPRSRNRRQNLVLTMLALAGCGGPVPVNLVTWDRFGVVTDPSPEVRELLDDSFGFWGLSYELSDGKAYGRLVVDIVDVGPEALIHGRHYDAGPCEKQVWADRRHPLLTHELGHVFGLTHGDADSDDHIMAPKDQGPEVSSDQIDEVKDNAYDFTGCRP